MCWCDDFLYWCVYYASVLGRGFDLPVILCRIVNLLAVVYILLSGIPKLLALSFLFFSRISKLHTVISWWIWILPIFFQLICPNLQLLLFFRFWKWCRFLSMSCLCISINHCSFSSWSAGHMHLCHCHGRFSLFNSFISVPSTWVAYDITRSLDLGLITCFYMKPLSSSFWYILWTFKLSLSFPSGFI